jgi:hypothetical protein
MPTSLVCDVDSIPEDLRLMKVWVYRALAILVEDFRFVSTPSLFHE